MAHQAWVPQVALGMRVGRVVVAAAELVVDIPGSRTTMGRRTRRTQGPARPSGRCTRAGSPSQHTLSGQGHIASGTPADWVARASQAEPAETEVVAVWQEAMVEMVAAQVVLEEKVVEAVVEAAAEERAAAVAASWEQAHSSQFSVGTRAYARWDRTAPPVVALRTDSMYS